MLGPVIGYLISLALPKEYTSQTVVLVEQPAVPQGYVTDIITNDLKQRLTTLQEQILSRSRLEAIINKFDLYAADRKQQVSMEALVDYFPGGGGFHVSPGVLLYNSNNLKATAAVPGGQAFDLGNATYLSNPANPINGSGKLTTNKVAPMLLLGFGNLVPRTRHFSMSFEFGAAFHGTPKATLSLAGSACDFSGLNCRNAATDPNVQSNVQAEVDKLNKSASPWKIYPVVSLGFGYKF